MSTLQSPQWQQALTTFSAALQTGQLDLAQFGLNSKVCVCVRARARACPFPCVYALCVTILGLSISGCVQPKLGHVYVGGGCSVAVLVLAPQFASPLLLELLVARV